MHGSPRFRDLGVWLPLERCWLDRRPRPLRDQAQRRRGSAEYYELRRYHLRRGPHTTIVDDYWRQAAIPALQRAGVGPIGTFNVLIGADSPSLYVLLVHPSLEAFASAAGQARRRC